MISFFIQILFQNFVTGSEYGNSEYMVLNFSFPMIMLEIRGEASDRAWLCASLQPFSYEGSGQTGVRIPETVVITVSTPTVGDDYTPLNGSSRDIMARVRMLSFLQSNQPTVSQ